MGRAWCEKGEERGAKARCWSLEEEGRKGEVELTTGLVRGEEMDAADFF